MTERQKTPVPRIGLRWPQEVAEALGVSADWLVENGIAAELKMLRRRAGGTALVSTAEVSRWLEANSSRLSDR